MIKKEPPPLFFSRNRSNLACSCDHMGFRNPSSLEEPSFLSLTDFKVVSGDWSGWGRVPRQGGVTRRDRCCTEWQSGSDYLYGPLSRGEWGAEAPPPESLHIHAFIITVVYRLGPWGRKWGEGGRYWKNWYWLSTQKRHQEEEEEEERERERERHGNSFHPRLQRELDHFWVKKNYFFYILVLISHIYILYVYIILFYDSFSFFKFKIQRTSIVPLSYEFLSLFFLFYYLFFDNFFPEITHFYRLFFENVLNSFEKYYLLRKWVLRGVFLVSILS